MRMTKRRRKGRPGKSSRLKLRSGWDKHSTRAPFCAHWWLMLDDSHHEHPRLMQNTTHN